MTWHRDHPGFVRAAIVCAAVAGLSAVVLPAACARTARPRLAAGPRRPAGSRWERSPRAADDHRVRPAAGQGDPPPVQHPRRAGCPGVPLHHLPCCPQDG